MRAAIIIVIIVAIPVMAYSATIKVPKDYVTIQAAIDATVNGDTVLVAPGKYVENIDFKGKAIKVKSEQGFMLTVIDGNQTGSVVTFNTGEGAASILEGFTIQNGSGVILGGSVTYGGGIYCNIASPTIMDNLLKDNHTDHGGGGERLPQYPMSGKYTDKGQRGGAVLP